MSVHRRMKVSAEGAVVGVVNSVGVVGVVKIHKGVDVSESSMVVGIVVERTVKCRVSVCVSCAVQQCRKEGHFLGCGVSETRNDTSIVRGRDLRHRLLIRSWEIMVQRRVGHTVTSGRRRSPLALACGWCWELGICDCLGSLDLGSSRLDRLTRRRQRLGRILCCSVALCLGDVVESGLGDGEVKVEGLLLEKVVLRLEFLNQNLEVHVLLCELGVALAGVELLKLLDAILQRLYILFLSLAESTLCRSVLCLVGVRKR